MLIAVTNIVERAVNQARHTRLINQVESDELRTVVLSHLIEHMDKTPRFAPNMPREIYLSRRAKFCVMDWLRKRARRARNTVIIQMEPEGLEGHSAFDHRAFRELLRTVLTREERRYFWRHYQSFDRKEAGKTMKTRDRIIDKLRMHMRLNCLTPDDYYSREPITLDTGTR